MPSLSNLSKLHKYLIEGRIKVISANSEMAVIKAEGSGDQPYTVIFTLGGWQCDCPARVAECVHIQAAKLISPLRVKEHVQLGTLDDDLSREIESLGGSFGYETDPDESIWDYAD